MRRWGLVALLILTIDQVCKFLAVTRLPEEGSRLHSLIAFALHKNYGIAFDLPVPSWIVIPLTLLIIIVAGVALWRHRTNPHLSAALIFIVLGGLGNLIDRIVYGYTVDYIILLTRSAINLSDLMILGGVIGLMKKRRSPSDGVRRGW